MRGRAFLAVGAAAALLAGAGCGAPDELESDDDRALAAAREGLDDALDTEEAIRTAPQRGRRLAAAVQRAQGSPVVVERLVPSLIEDGKVNGPALEAFVRYAPTDAPRALLIPAERSIDDMIEVIDDSGADGDTKVPHAEDQPLERFVDEVDRDISEVWPSLSKELEEAL